MRDCRPPGIEHIGFRVIDIAANGPVVLTEREDVFSLSDRSFELPVIWRDYFDVNQFTSRMG